MRKIFFIGIFFSTLNFFSQTGFISVSGFGTNPGNLTMYKYVPGGISGNVPLVVVMHGCTQSATIAHNETGWSTLADRHKFYVVYPEQNASNNSSYCFNWFQPGDQDRNQGEALSIKQMVDYMKANYSIDTNKIFVTGLSAGACMTTVMCACYPEIFKKGAVMAGAPYKSATNFSQAISVGQGSVTNSPSNWGMLVKNEYPGYTGSYPTIAVFQGSADNVISPVNETEVMKQWTNVHNTDQTADVTVNSFNGNAFVTKNVYNDSNGTEAVETFTLSGMGHALALDTGQCYQQCGRTGNYSYEVYFSATFFAAYFFDILIPPYSISGPVTVNANQTGVTYSVTNTGGSSYNWSFPNGAMVASGQGTNLITVNFGTQSGYVEVTETQSNNCKNGPTRIYVTVTNGSGIQHFNSQEIKVLQLDGNEILIASEKARNAELKLYNALGENVFHERISCNEKIHLNLKSGFYVAEIHAGNSMATKKILLSD